MRRTAFAFGFACMAAGLGAEPLRVVTTVPDMADFARQIGGAEVTVESIASGKVDLHFFVPRPRHASMLRRADFLIVGGLAIDVWANALIESSGNPRIRYGAEGYLDPAIGVKALEVPQGRIDGSRGDVHPFGNPHYWFTERNVLRVIANVAAGLSRQRPEKAEYFRRNAEAYRAAVRAAFAELRALLAPHAGAKIVQYHASWTYFAREFGLEIIGEVEPKPGIPPSARHLSELIDRMNGADAKLVIAEPYYPQAPLDTISSATGVSALRLPLYLGGREETPDYLSNLKRNVEEIAKALAR